MPKHAWLWVPYVWGSKAFYPPVPICYCIACDTMHHNTRPWYHGLAMHDTEQAHQCNLERDIFRFVPLHSHVAMSMFPSPCIATLPKATWLAEFCQCLSQPPAPLEIPLDQTWFHKRGSAHMTKKWQKGGFPAPPNGPPKRHGAEQCNHEHSDRPFRLTPKGASPPPPQ